MFVSRSTTLLTGSGNLVHKNGAIYCSRTRGITTYDPDTIWLTAADPATLLNLLLFIRFRGQATDPQRSALIAQTQPCFDLIRQQQEQPGKGTIDLYKIERIEQITFSPNGGTFRGLAETSPTRIPLNDNLTLEIESEQSIPPTLAKIQPVWFSITANIGIPLAERKEVIDTFYRFAYYITTEPYSPKLN